MLCRIFLHCFPSEYSFRFTIADFVIYLGDVVTANNLPIPNASLYWTGQFLRREAEGSPGPQFLGTMMMRHSSGHLTGFLPAESQKFVVRQQTSHLQVPEIIFWHIPSIAFSKVAPKPNSEIDKPCVGSINLESVAPQDAEWGIMDILAKRPSVKAIFSGHNHGLDWCCPYQKLWLCFARHTGYGGYGDWPRGARIIEITEQPFSLKSWIRMENGTEHSDLILSS
uniref:Inactive purple acid phosphatase 16 n=1 Tax=Ananas comosus var. bracteatus TaxID=296719 RepID=A0A6V7PRF9_ANACO|nr:unnamed protein product [Ananas comosus var. bracteatus]